MAHGNTLPGTGRECWSATHLWVSQGPQSGQVYKGGCCCGILSKANCNVIGRDVAMQIAIVVQSLQSSCCLHTTIEDCAGQRRRACRSAPDIQHGVICRAGDDDALESCCPLKMLL